jgi:hypothetical protein
MKFCTVSIFYSSYYTKKEKVGVSGVEKERERTPFSGWKISSGLQLFVARLAGLSEPWLYLFAFVCVVL